MRAEFADVWIGDVEHLDRDLGRVGVSRDVIVGEVAHDRQAVDGIEQSFFGQRRAQPEDHAAHELRARGAGIDQPAAVIDSA